MKNNWFIILVSILLVVVSCSGDDDDKTFYTVTFNADGGSPVPSAQKVEDGGTVTVPTDNPVKPGYVFVFWYLDGTSTAYNFQTPVNRDITLYAEWRDEASVEYWQVAWELNGGTWPASGDNHETKVIKGGTLAEPAAPVKAGNIFEGWYKESALTNKVIFPYDISNSTENITLYAKWKNEGGPDPTTFKISNTNEWSNAVSIIRSNGNNKSYTLIIDGTVSVPPTTGVKKGDAATYTFGEGEKLAVTISGNGTLNLSGNGFLVCMSGKAGAKQKLIIDGPTLQGRSDNIVPLLRFDYADLELRKGKITRNVNNGGGGSGFGGGVYIERGIINMSGGEISDNTCGQTIYVAHGGGVALSYSTFNLSGGVISGNTGNLGGAVYVGDYAFNMTGGEIKGNTAMSSSPYGGAVYASGYGSFSKTGGIVYGSDADEVHRNKVTDYEGNVLNRRGAVAFCPVDIVVGNGDDRRRETTLGENDHISTTEDPGWE